MRLRQVLINLTDNAIKFTKSGAVVVMVSNQAARDGESRLHFSVADSGIGIPAHKQNAIFEAFAQADGSTTRTYGGTGLGLSIASQLIQKMHGKIWIDSKVGEGTTFHFTAGFGMSATPLPVMKAADLGGMQSTPIPMDPGAPTGERGPGRTESLPSGLRILLAEDNIINRALTTAILEKHGHSLVHAANGREVVEAAARGTFDMIFMDVQMPEVDGFEATRRIRESERDTGRHIPIAAMTAHAMAGDRERCLASGMDDYLSKPLEKNALFALLDRVSAGPVADEAPALDPARPCQSDAPQGLAQQSFARELPIFSREKLLDDLDGDEALLGRLIALFHENAPRILDDIRTSIARRGSASLAFAAHSLVSYLGVFGAHDARRLAQELEAAAPGEDYENAGRTFAALERGIAEINAALSRFHPIQALAPL
jgi:CheY-like chemotaxis protein